jgi:hypothetical protein
MRPSRIHVFGVVDVKVDAVVADALKSLGLHIAFWSAPREEEYPWVMTNGNVPQEPLHLWVWRFFDRPQPKEDEIIHHVNKRKNDARIKNLVLMRRDHHARHHMNERQRFTIRKKTIPDGFYCPQPPAPVKTITGPMKMEIEKTLLARQQLEEEEKKALQLANAQFNTNSYGNRDPQHIDAIFEELFSLEHPWRIRSRISAFDSGQNIPPPPRRTHEDRGLPRIRLGCTHAECGLVYELVDQGFELAAVAADTKLPVSIIAGLMKTPAVSKAIENWQKYQRLPKPCTLNNLGVFGADVKKRLKKNI